MGEVITIFLLKNRYFSEIQFDKINNIYGINITFVTSTEVDDEAYDLFKGFWMPYKNKNQ